MRTTDYKNRRVVEKYFKKTLAGVFINYPAILKLLRGIKGKTVLDLGCGAGWLAKKIYMKGASVYAVDSSPKMAQLRQDKAH